jgi:ATP-dependent helicase/nuclease subunit A
MASNALLPKPAKAKWTDAQWAGIATTGRSLLVSAAAGSGKTAVLAERCAYLVCDAPQPCDVDELLVVTFTEAAAAEMKSRIEKALHARINNAHDNRLARQLALIDRAHVSTLHGFCSRVIRQHFHLLELDPSFIVIDGDEAALLRREVARDLLAEHYDAADADAFTALIDAYGEGDDERLINKIIKTHELRASLIDPAKWIATARARIEEPLNGDFRKSALAIELEAQMQAGLATLAQTCERSLRIAMGGFEKYVADLRSCGQIVRHWREVLQSDGIDALCEEVQVELPRLPPMKASPEKEVAKGLVDAVREEIKGGSLRKMLAFSTSQWRDGLTAVLPHARMFLQLVEEFGHRYTREKAALRGVDFSDLERMTLRALRDSSRDGLNPSAVAKMMHKQFKHVLVDEYQDINEVQDAILALASRECLGKGSAGNLFCVGDVKQSIYRFRLAEPTRFLRRQERFNDPDATFGGQVIDLQSNFRSRPPLLAALNQVFGRLMTRDAADISYDATHQLHPGLKFPKGDASCFTGEPIELHVLPAKMDDHVVVDASDAEGSTEDEPDRTQREAILIAQQIQKLMGKAGGKPMCVMERGKDGEMRPRPIRYGDIVILLRSMRFKGEDYAEVLRRSDIPVHSESGSGYFESMEVADMLALLKVLDNRAQDIPLAAVLRSPIAALPEPEDALARIRLAYPDKTIPFHHGVVRYASEKEDELAAKLRDVLAQLDHWRLMAQRRPLAELIWDVYDSTGYLAFCAGLRDGEQRKANLIDLHDRARQFGSFQRQGLARFLSFLDSLRDESDLGPPPVVSEGEDVVRIMTIHHSKGLEFPVVFLPDLGKKINLQDCSGSILIDRDAYLGMDVVDESRQVRYPSLASTLVSNRLRRQSMAEELRVLYVAMTRAKEHLVLIGTAKEGVDESWRARWTGHEGAMPADAVLGAMSMLDWLGPVAAMSDAMQIVAHNSEEVRDWPSPESLRATEGERQQRLARLEPLSPAPARDVVADEIIARLTTPYRFDAFTRLAAVEAATALTKKATAVGEHKGADAAFGRTLELPRAVRTELKPSAADIGEATHLVLQHVDFTRACDVTDLKAQVANLVAKRLISPAAAESVDVDSICWLIGSSAGQLMHKHASTIRRELPLYLAMPPHELNDAARSTDPQDRVMIRSRLDVLLHSDRGLELIDYKTDRVTEATLPQRIETYRPQMELYRRAVKAIAGEEVFAVHLVFLGARVVHTL